MGLPQPSATVGIKLASAIHHAMEAIGPKGTPTDIAAFQGVMEDPEVREYLSALQEAALLPVMR